MSSDILVPETVAVVGYPGHWYPLAELQNEGELSEPAIRAFESVFSGQAHGEIACDGPTLEYLTHQMIRLCFPVVFTAEASLNSGWIAWGQHNDATEFRVTGSMVGDVLFQFCSIPNLPVNLAELYLTELGRTLSARPGHTLTTVAFNWGLSFVQRDVPASVLGSLWRAVFALDPKGGMTNRVSQSITRRKGSLEGRLMLNPHLPASVKFAIACGGRLPVTAEQVRGLLHQMDDEFPDLVGLPEDMKFDLASTLPLPEQWNLDLFPQLPLHPDAVPLGADGENLTRTRKLLGWGG